MAHVPAVRTIYKVPAVRMYYNDAFKTKFADINVMMMTGPALRVKRRHNLARALREIKEDPRTYERHATYVYLYEIPRAVCTFRHNVCTQHLGPRVGWQRGWALRGPPPHRHSR